MKITAQGALNAAITGTAVAYAASEFLVCRARQRAAMALVDVAGRIAVTVYRGESHQGTPDGSVAARVTIVGPSLAHMLAMSAAGTEALRQRAQARTDAALATWLADDANDITAGLDDLLAAVFADQAEGTSDDTEEH